MISEGLEWYDLEMQLNSFKFRKYLFLCRPERSFMMISGFFQLAVENVCALFDHVTKILLNKN